MYQSLLSAIARLRVVVIGDLILDEYIDCRPTGLSRADAAVVVEPTAGTIYAGGAGCVAAHAAALGANTVLVTVLGEDELAGIARDLLRDASVLAAADATRPTPLKKRYRARGKTLLRVNQLRQHPLDGKALARLIELGRYAIDSADLVLFSDFGLGCLPIDAITPLIERSRTAMTAADCQLPTDAHGVDWHYPAMDLITPSETEARQMLQDDEADIAHLAEGLQVLTGASNVVITRGALGAYVLTDTGKTFEVSAFNSEPRDCVGAGDALFACSALALRAGQDIKSAVTFGSRAAAAHVAKIGNGPISRNDVILPDRACVPSS